MSLTFTARTPADLRYRDVVGDMVRALCRHVELVESAGGVETRVVSAFNEAFNNVVEHAYGPNRYGDIVVSAIVDTVRFVLTIDDYGRGFDYDETDCPVLPEVDAMDAGGMGLFIIHGAMTKVKYERGEPNRMTMSLDLAGFRHQNPAVLPNPNDEGSRC